MKIKDKFEAEAYFKELSSLIMEFTTNYSQQVIQKILEKEEYITEPKRFYYTLIHKTNCTLDSVNIFIRNFDSKRNYHSSLFILLRSILNDIILAEFIIINTENDVEKKELIERIYFDHIDNVIKTCEKTLRHLHRWNSEQTEKQIKDIKKNSRFFDLKGEPKLKPIASSPNPIIRKIFAKNLKEGNSKLLKIAFDQFSLFSKFEHFGELSFKLTHRGYDDNEQQNLRSELHYSIRIIISALNNYAKLWDEEININPEYFSKLLTEITELLPEKINCN
jgi:hypothetical protein